MGRTHVDYLPLGSTAESGDGSSPRTLGTGETSDEEDGASETNLASSIYVCAECGVHLTKYSSLISREFRGRSGQASLFHYVINTVESAPEDRMLITGKHTICDIFCVACNAQLGWKYIHAFSTSQRYKVGKVILERAFVKKISERGSTNAALELNDSLRAAPDGAPGPESSQRDISEVVMDERLLF